jgi:hypothetical protein
MKHATILSLRAATETQLAAIALKMAEVHPTTFEKLLVETVALTPPLRTFNVKWGNDAFQGFDAHLTNDQLRKFAARNGPNDKVTCIKMIREELGIGLKEAKELSENLEFMKAINAGWIYPGTSQTIDGRSYEAVYGHSRY